jgi:hypothetical protein
VAVVSLHVHKYKKKVTRKFKLEGLHERHVVATGKLGNHLQNYEHSDNGALLGYGRKKKTNLEAIQNLRIRNM